MTTTLTPQQRQHARDLLARLRAHPDTFDMEVFWERAPYEAPPPTFPDDPADWPCGTVACLAGHSCILTGWLPAPQRGNPCWSVDQAIHPDRPDDDPQTVTDIAAENLGLPGDLRHALFYDHGPGVETRVLGRLARAAKTGQWETP